MSPLRALAFLRQRMLALGQPVERRRLAPAEVLLRHAVVPRAHRFTLVSPH